MLTHGEYIDDEHQGAADQEYEGPAWYAWDLNGIVAGPFDDFDQCEWWIGKAKRV